jgi:excisionase family DNA binding protein
MSNERKLSEEMAELKAELFDLESQLAQKMARARVLFAKGEDLTAHAEAEIRRRDFKVYTEDEAAELLKVSKDTLQRLRQRHALPHTQAGSLIRYTDEQLARAAEILERPRRKAKP